MYCSKKSCFNEPYPDVDNWSGLCLDHWKEAKAKATKLDYSKLQTLSKDQEQ